METQKTRLRPPPVERFAGEIHRIDFGAVLEDLKEEAPNGNGHRQVALFHHGRVTQILFAFDADSELKEHSANGLVTIHALSGQLTVQASGETHSLTAGTMLVLLPGVKHNVLATVASDMLLTVHREEKIEEKSQDG